MFPKWLFLLSSLQVWQSSEDALLQMVVVVLLRLAVKNNMLPMWDSLETGGQLLLVSLVLFLCPLHTGMFYSVLYVIAAHFTNLFKNNIIPIDP